MKTHLLAAELARLVPELARDCVVNRETVIRGMLDNALAEGSRLPDMPHDLKRAIEVLEDGIPFISETTQYEREAWKVCYELQKHFQPIYPQK